MATKIKTAENGLMKRLLYPLLVTLLLAVMFGLMFFSAKGDSNIVDEIAHVPAGYSYLTTGDYRLNPEHPPIIKDLAALPLVFMNVKFPYDYFYSNNPVVNNQWEMGWKFIYKLGNNTDAMVLASRVPIMLLSLLFGYFVYRWASELWGKKSGIFALVLFVFNANIIAHSRFVTTDLGISFAFFLAMYALYRYLLKPSWRGLFVAGLGFGLVLITKFSAATLIPTYGLVWILLMIRKGNEVNKPILQRINDKKWLNRGLSGLLAFVVIGIVGLTVMWLFYVPHTINMPAQVQRDLIAESGVGPFTAPLQTLSNSPITKPLAQWLLGFAMVTSHVQGGHDAFLLGQTSNQGWWYYYPVTIAIKTQIGLFILLALTLLLIGKLEKKDWFNEVFLWVLPLVLLAMGMQGKINLGIRYMLPIYAFVFLFVARLGNVISLENLRKVKNNFAKFALSWIVLASMVWYVLSGILIYPHYLAYYNEFVGGYKNGYKYLTDSNTDWGQDIKRLAEWVEDNNVDKIAVDVFPGAFEAQHHIGEKMVEWHVQNGRPQGYFAVSATFYQNSKLKKGANNGMDYSWLDEIEPIENLGGSILIYKL